MANHKSAKKRIRQSEKRRQSNKWKTSRVRTELKKMRTALETGDKETATSLFPKLQSMIAKLAKGSALNKATAARRTSRIAAQVSRL